MSVHPDDEALRWDVPLDPSHTEVPAGSTSDTDGSGAASDHGVVVQDAADESALPGSTGSALLVVYGVFGGIFALYMVGWIIAVSRDSFVQASLFAEIMYQLGETLAIAAPAIWMASALWLTAGRPALVRVLWLLAGLVVVAPWPFILKGFGA